MSKGGFAIVHVHSAMAWRGLIEVRDETALTALNSRVTAKLCYWSHLTI